MRELNNSDITALLNEFLLEFQTPILSLYDAYFRKNKSDKSYREVIEILEPILKEEAIEFINRYNDLENLKGHLFYSVNEWLRKNSPPPKTKSRPYIPICQACIFLGQETILDALDKALFCSLCKENLKTETDPKKKLLLQSFATHFSKNGFKCGDCKRFIPDTSSNQIFCPFPDCSFIGEKIDLTPFKNPANPNAQGQTFDWDDEVFAPQVHQSEEAKILLTTIDTLISQEVWKKNFGRKVKSKLYALQSFKRLIETDPETMTDYLLHQTRPGNIQSRLFQEFIGLVENDLPIQLLPRKKKEFRAPIENLLDPKLGMFDGVSVFEGTVVNGEIENGTTEFYVGGRKGEVSAPFFIGKILNVVEKETGKILMDRVESYTFTKIKMKGLTEGTKVVIMHLRIPPHYQMGAMVYVNRARKKILEALENSKI